MSIAYKSVGTSTATGATVAIFNYPNGITTGDMIVLGVVNKYPPNVPGTLTGYTAITNGQGTGGAVAAGTDAGTVTVSTFYKVAVGSETGAATVSVPSGNSSGANVTVYSPTDAGYDWVTPVAGWGADSTRGTSWSITAGSTMDIILNDMVAVISGANADAQTYSAEVFSCGGITIGSNTERLDVAITGGNDTRLVMSTHPISAGTATTAGTFTMTANGTLSAGASVIVRLREQWARGTVSPAEGAQAQVGDTAIVYGAYPVASEQGFQAQTGATASGTFAAPSSIVANIDHETNDLTQYTSTVTDSGDLSVDAAAALAGTGYGLKVVIDDTTAIYGEKTIPASANIRMRFYFDPNTYVQTNANETNILNMGQDGGSSLIFMRMYTEWYTATGYRLSLIARNDAGANAVNWDYALISDEPHYIEISAVRATGSDTNDGSYNWWVDGVDQGGATGVDNYNLMTDTNFYMRFGAPREVAATMATSTLYIDEIVVNNSGDEIGPVSSSSSSTTPQDGFQTQTGDTAGVSAGYSITGADGFQAQVGDAATVRAGYPLAPAQGNQTQVGDAATVRAAYSIAPAEGNQSQSGDVPTVSAGYVITFTEGNQTQIGDTSTLSEVVGLPTVTPADGFQAQNGDAAVVRAGYNSSPAEGNQAQAGDTATVRATYPISPVDGFQAQSGDSAVVFAGYFVVGDQGYQTQTMDAVTLTELTATSAQTPRQPIIVAGNSQSIFAKSVHIDAIRADINAEQRNTIKVE